MPIRKLASFVFLFHFSDSALLCLLQMAHKGDAVQLQALGTYLYEVDTMNMTLLWLLQSASVFSALQIH